MATRRYKISPGMTEFQVVEEAGAANNSHIVELTVDLAGLVNITSGTRTIEREEVLEALEKIRDYILTHNWTPA